jgi:hypothetical protein
MRARVPPGVEDLRISIVRGTLGAASDPVECDSRNLGSMATA